MSIRFPSWGGGGGGGGGGALQAALSVTERWGSHAAAKQDTEHTGENWRGEVKWGGHWASKTDHCLHVGTKCS